MTVQPFEFTCGPKLIAGPGAAGRLAGLLPAGRCLFVTDANVRALGLADGALKSLAAAGLEVAIFDAVEQDPSLDTLVAAVAAGEGATAVVGFGGGSPMDVAKLAAYLLGSGDAARRHLGRRQGDRAAAPARARPDHRRHRLGSDRGVGDHRRRGRQEGGQQRRRSMPTGRCSTRS